jgi:hypothetical protein
LGGGGGVEGDISEGEAFKRGVIREGSLGVSTTPFFSFKVHVVILPLLLFLSHPHPNPPFLFPPFISLQISELIPSQNFHHIYILPHSKPPPPQDLAMLSEEREMETSKAAGLTPVGASLWRRECPQMEGKG